MNTLLHWCRSANAKGSDAVPHAPSGFIVDTVKAKPSVHFCSLIHSYAFNVQFDITQPQKERDKKGRQKNTCSC